nr:hypothetical protein [Gammaproteobacteria bacterium]
MSNITLDEMVPLVTREASARRKTLLTIFAVVALLFLLLAAFWQKQYESYAHIYVDDKSVVAPILDQAPTQERNQANIAKQELFSAEILDKIMLEVPFIDENTGDVERERIRNEIIESTNVQNMNNQLIRIEFQDPDPSVAYRTVELYSNLFLAKTMKTSSDETNEAFDFIIDQVETYRNKLEDADRRLESFRAQYPGLSETGTGRLNDRVLELERELEQTQLLYAQADQRRRSLQRELSSESTNLARQAQADQLRSRISALQGEIDSLRLSYTDDYPDIIRLKQQIGDLENQAANPTQSSGGFGATLNSPVYQQLRSDLAAASAEADSLRSKINQLSILKEKEVERSTDSGRVEREYAELTRDYTI